MSTPVIVYCFSFLFRRSKLGFDVASVGNWRESLATESTLAATVDRESAIWPSQLWIVRCVDYKTFSFSGVVGDNVGRWCATVQTTKLSDFRQIFTTNFQQLFLLYFSCSLSQGCLISSCLLTFLQISPPRFSAPTRNNHSSIHSFIQFSRSLFFRERVKLPDVHLLSRCLFNFRCGYGYSSVIFTPFDWVPLGRPLKFSQSAVSVLRLSNIWHLPKIHLAASSKKFLFRSDSIFDGNLIGNSDMRYVCLKSEIMSVMFCWIICNKITKRVGSVV